MKIMINANDLRTIRFPSNTSFILRNILFRFPHAVAVQSVLIEISEYAAKSAPADVEVKIYGTTAVEPASEEMIRKSKSIEEMFREALDASFCDTPDDQLEDEPLLLDAVSEMIQFFYERELFPYEKEKYSDELYAEIGFSHFAECLEHWWVNNVCGKSKALELARELFDAYDFIYK